MQEYLQAARQEVLDEYRESGQFREDMADLLRPSMEQTFAQVHDYRQLISQIIQHVNVYLETTLPGLSLDGQMERTNSNIRSIYWAARLMEFKLLSALFLANPERITDPRSKRVFRFHGAVHKYIQIYKPLMELGNLRLRVFGESRGSLMENPDAIGVIPQAFLDNAIKYAPPGSEIVVTFAEDDDSITLAVQSDGPKILPDEMRRVFEIFFRGSAAKKSGEEGTGFGLGLAQLIADKVDATLSVEQGSQRLDNQAFRTTFSATLPKPVAGESPPSIVNARGRQRGGGRPD